MTLPTSTSPLSVILLAGFALSLLAPAAHAQNALGDGRALDRNLSTQGRFNNSRPSFADDLRFRNAVVTGNVGGGRSFRGDIGYTSGSDFRGDLGSNDIFTFRRESSFSGRFNNPSLRGLSGLNTNIGSTVGYSPAARSAAVAGRDSGGLLVARDGAGVSGASFQGFDPLTGTRNRPAPSTNSYAAPERIDDRSLDFSAESGNIGALRSISTHSTIQSLAPSMVGQRREYDGSITTTTASSLRGVRAYSQLADGSPATPSTPPNPAIPTAPTGAVSQSLTNPALPGSPTLVQTRTAYDSMIDRYSSLSGNTREETPSTGSQELDWRAKLDALRGTLDGASGPSLLPPTDGPTLKLDDTPPQATNSPYDQATLDMIRARAGETDRLLLNEESALGAFGERMRRAQAAMIDGRYFDAEEAFTVCLTVRPGDVAASVGRLHAQIGAGMYLSAAINLRLLHAQHPEIIGERYTGGIIPSDERLDAIIPDLRRYAVADNTLSKESALLLAYLGFQRSDLELTLEGLDRLDTLVDDADARFATLLREIWIPLLENPSQPQSPQPQPEPDNPPEGGADDPR